MADERGFIYQFSGFRLNPSEHCLEHGGEVTYLRPKTFETLLYLVKHHGYLVEKGELLDQVWADTIVTEGTMTQSIKEIRVALQDDAAQPSFLKTIPRVGYKFIAKVETVSPDKKDQSIAEPDHTLSQEQPPVSHTLFPESHRRRKWFSGIKLWRYFAILIGLTVIGSFLYSLLKEHPALSFSPRDWVLVTNFQNYTGEEVFAAALRTALERELSRSSYLNVVPRGRVLDVLRLMKHELNSKIDQQLGREICLRDGDIRVLLSGSIEEIGGMYEITVKLIDPINDRLVTSLSEGANEKRKVLPAIRRLAREVRKSLGESLPSIARTERQLARVSTPSLQALALYSKGWQFANLFDWNRAQTFLEGAIAADSSFAMAHAILGYAYLWLGNLTLSQAHFAYAAHLAESITEREKYFILGSNADYGLGDHQQAIANFELLVQLYPDDYWGHENLSLDYEWTGNIKRWQEHKQACVRIRPNYAINHSDLGFYALFVRGDMDKAHTEFSRALKLNPDLPFALPNLSEALLEWMNGDLAGAEGKISTFFSQKIGILLPDYQVMGRWYTARFYFYAGKNDKALKLLEAALAQARKQPNINLIAWSRLYLALSYWELGCIEDFQHLMSRLAAHSVGLVRVEALGWWGIYLARSGKIDRARYLRDELQQEQRQMPVDIIHPPLPDEMARARRAFSTQIEGELALAQKDTENAIVRFNKVIKLVPPSQLPAMTALDSRLYLVANQSLAHIYEQLYNWDAAIIYYQAILDHKTLNIIVPAASLLWVNTLNDINRVLLQHGDLDKAARYRDHFLRLRLKAQ